MNWIRNSGWYFAFASRLFNIGSQPIIGFDRGAHTNGTAGGGQPQRQRHLWHRFNCCWCQLNQYRIFVLLIKCVAIDAKWPACMVHSKVDPVFYISIIVFRSVESRVHVVCEYNRVNWGDNMRGIAGPIEEIILSVSRLNLSNLPGRYTRSRSKCVSLHLNLLPYTFTST